MICNSHIIPSLGALKIKNIHGRHINLYLKKQTQKWKN